MDADASECSFLEHTRQRHERRASSLPQIFLLWDHVYHYGAAEPVHFSAGLASVVCARWTDAVALGVGSYWG